MTKSSSYLSDKVFVIASLGAVAAAGIAGFVLLGSPVEQRLISLDTERVDDLSKIARQLWNQTGQGVSDRFEPLPGVLPKSEQRQDTYLDPETGEPYEYQRLSDTEYALCATFARDSDARDDNRSWRSPEWDHPAGFHCYQFDTASPEPSLD